MALHMPGRVSWNAERRTADTEELRQQLRRRGLAPQTQLICCMRHLKIQT
jgi:hypothetical protein